MPFLRKIMKEMLMKEIEKTRNVPRYIFQQFCSKLMRFFSFLQVISFASFLEKSQMDKLSPIKQICHRKMSLEASLLWVPDGLDQ